MNKFIETDICNGLTYLRCAIMNAIALIRTGEETEVDLGEDIPLSLVKKCFEKLKFKVVFEASTVDRQYRIIYMIDNTQIYVQSDLDDETLVMTLL